MSGPVPTMDTATASSRSGVEQVSALLERMCAINDVAREYGVSKVTEFHSVWKPDLPIFDYLARIQRLTSCSNHCFVLALIYLDTVQRRVGLTVDSLSVHRLMLTAVMIAIKFSEDHPHRNKVYAKAGGLSLQELNQLEVKLLFALDFDLNVSTEEFSAYDAALVRASQQPTNSKQPRAPSPKEARASPTSHAKPCPPPIVVIKPVSPGAAPTKSAQTSRVLSDTTDESDTDTSSRWAVIKSVVSRVRSGSQSKTLSAAESDVSRSPSSKRSMTAAEGMLSPSDNSQREFVFETKGLDSELDTDVPSPRDLISSSDASASDFSALSPHSVTRPLGQLRLSAPRSRSPSKSSKSTRHQVLAPTMAQ